MDYFDMAGNALINDLKEFTYQVERLSKKLSEIKDKKDYLNLVEDKNLNQNNNADKRTSNSKEIISS